MLVTKRFHILFQAHHDTQTLMNSWHCSYAVSGAIQASSLYMASFLIFFSLALLNQTFSHSCRLTLVTHMSWKYYVQTLSRIPLQFFITSRSYFEIFTYVIDFFLPLYPICCIFFQVLYLDISFLEVFGLHLRFMRWTISFLQLIGVASESCSQPFLMHPSLLVLQND